MKYSPVVGIGGIGITYGKNPSSNKMNTGSHSVNARKPIDNETKLIADTPKHNNDGFSDSQRGKDPKLVSSLSKNSIIIHGRTNDFKSSSKEQKTKSETLNSNSNSNTKFIVKKSVTARPKSAGKSYI